MKYYDDCAHPDYHICTAEYTYNESTSDHLHVIAAQTMGELMARVASGVYQPSLMMADYTHVPFKLYGGYPFLALGEGGKDGVAISIPFSGLGVQHSATNPVSQTFFMRGQKTFFLSGNVVNTIVDLDMSSPTAPPKILRRGFAVAMYNFRGNGFPEFGADCSDHASPFCTSVHQFYGELPPNWTMIEYPVRSHGFVKGIVKVECSNIKGTAPGDTLSITATFTNPESNIVTSKTAKTPGTAAFATADAQTQTLDNELPSEDSSSPFSPQAESRPKQAPVVMDPAEIAAIRSRSDFISLANGNRLIVRDDPAEPVTCSVVMELNNKISPPPTTHRPWVIHNEPLYNVRFSQTRVIPRFAFGMVVAKGHDSCRTQPMGGMYRCLTELTFHGSPQNPFNQLTAEITIDPTSQSFYLSRAGTYPLFTRPVYPTNLSQVPSNATQYHVGFLQIVQGAGNTLLLSLSGISDAFSSSERTLFMGALRPSPPNLLPTFYNPKEVSFKLPNQVLATVEPMTLFGAAATGNFFHHTSSKLRYEQAGLIPATYSFRLKQFTSMTIATDLGLPFGLLSPCIETADGSQISQAVFTELQALVSDLGGESSALKQIEYLAQLFPAEQVRILGFLSPMDVSTSLPSSDPSQSSDVTWTRFLANPLVNWDPVSTFSSSAKGASVCTFYHEINSRFPTASIDVKHSIHGVTGLGEDIYAYQSYPQFVPSAYILAYTIDTPTIDAPTPNAAAAVNTWVTTWVVLVNLLAAVMIGFMLDATVLA